MRNYANLEEAIRAVNPSIERSFRCHVHDDRHASASVNIIKGLWTCYSCGAGGRVNLSDIQTDMTELRDQVMEMLREEDIGESEGLLKLFTAKRHPYWQSRFTDAAIDHFQLGYNPFDKMVCYPFRDPGGDLIGFVRRNNDTGGGPKYLYPKGTVAQEFLFNFNYDRQYSVTLFEGAMDVVAAWDAGLPTGLGIYGARFSLTQLELIMKIQPVVVNLCFDNDSAGELATSRAKGMLRHYEIREFPWHQWEGYKDLGEMDLKTRTKAVEFFTAA